MPFSVVLFLVSGFQQILVICISGKLSEWCGTLPLHFEGRGGKVIVFAFILSCAVPGRAISLNLTMSTVCKKEQPSFSSSGWNPSCMPLAVLVATHSLQIGMASLSTWSFRRMKAE